MTKNVSKDLIQHFGVATSEFVPSHFGQPISSATYCPLAHLLAVATKKQLSCSLWK